MPTRSARWGNNLSARAVPRLSAGTKERAVGGTKTWLRRWANWPSVMCLGWVLLFGLALVSVRREVTLARVLSVPATAYIAVHWFRRRPVGHRASRAASR